MPIITVRRHSFAEPAKGDTRADDLARPLSHAGKCAARELAAYRHYDLVLASPARRTTDTAAIIGCGGDRDQVTRLEELCYPESYPGLGAMLCELWEKLGNKGSLNEYSEINPSLKIHGTVALMRVLSEITKGNAHTTLVVGHVPLIQAMGWAATLIGPGKENERSLMGRVLYKELEGFRLTIEGTTLVRLETL